MKSLNTILSLWLFFLISGCTNAQQSEVVHQKANYNKLTNAEKQVIVNKGTERAYSGKYDDFYKDGIYLCKRCNLPLFKSEDKFNSKTGWPSFDDMIEDNVEQQPDRSMTEDVCANCGAHLGHVFKGEGFTPKNTRHCINSVALQFVPQREVDE